MGAVADGSFRKLGGTLSWGVFTKDPTIWGTTLGSPIFGNPHKGVLAIEGGGRLNLWGP